MQTYKVKLIARRNELTVLIDHVAVGSAARKAWQSQRRKINNRIRKEEIMEGWEKEARDELSA